MTLSFPRPVSKVSPPSLLYGAPLKNGLRWYKKGRGNIGTTGEKGGFELAGKHPHLVKSYRLNIPREESFALQRQKCTRSQRSFQPKDGITISRGVLCIAGISMTRRADLHVSWCYKVSHGNRAVSRLALFPKRSRAV